MKTFLVQLEKFDNLASTLEKMHWAKARRILLIWPRRGKISLSLTDIELIKREAIELGADVAFVSHDPTFMEIGTENNVSVFLSVPQAESARWLKAGTSFNKNADLKKKPRLLDPNGNKEKKLATSGKVAQIAAVVIAACAILAMLVFFLPAARVTIYPELTEKVISIDILASPDIVEPNINGSLPAKIQVIQVSKTASAQSSGKTQLPNSYAQGTVTFHNLSGQTVTVPKGTILACSVNPEIKFMTLEEATVDPLVSSESVKIQAVKGGSEGNQEAGVANLIDGPLAVVLEVTNETSIIGGSDVEAPSPTEEDYAQLKANLLVQMRSDALNQIPSPGTALISSTLDQGKVVSEIRSVEPGTASDTFSLTLGIEYRVLTYSVDELNSLVKNALVAGIDSRNTIYGQGVSITSQTTPIGTVEDGARWTIIASAQTGVKVNEGDIFQAITGMTIPDANAILQYMVPEREPAMIDLFPRGWTRLPWFSLQIHVGVE
jgi:hypothetical protein